MKYLKYLVVILLFSSSGLFAQKTDSLKYIQMTGIAITDSMFRIPFVKVHDLNTNKGVYADYYGYFALVVHPGDTIQFSCLGYKKKKYVVSDTMKLDEFTLVQVMQYDTIIADPVPVYPWPSKEQFAEYFVNMDSPFNQMELARKRLSPQELAFIGIMMTGDAQSAYSNSQYQFMQQQYSRGQTPQNNLLNPAAWSEFMQGLGTGRYQISQ